MNATPPASPASPQPPLPSATGATPPPDGWAVDTGRGVAWWSEGWRLFAAAPVMWIVITLIYVALMIALHFIPLIGQIAGTILTPVLAGGVLLGCRKLDRGGELGIPDLFTAFSGGKLGPLVLVGVLYFAGWLVAFLIALAVAAAVFGFGSLSALWRGDAVQMLTAISAAALVMALVVLLVALPLVMAYWFAPALVALRGDEPLASLRTSFVASLRNILPFFVYSLLGVVFAIAATIPLGLGWLVLAPMFAASVYASYKDIFGD